MEQNAEIKQPELVKVATKDGHALFWEHEVHHIQDFKDNHNGQHCRIVLRPNGLDPTYLHSTWSADRVRQAIQEARK